MTTGTNPQTELEAVNLMLGAIFEAPVNVIDVVGIEDVATAKRTLDAELRTQMLKGNAHNVERNVTLTPDAITGKIPLPINVLRVDVEASDGLDGVQRGLFLYNRVDHTFVYTRAVKAEITYHLEWSDLPEHIKTPVVILAARKFQAEVLGSADKGKYNQSDEDEAREILGASEADIGDHNILTDNYTVSNILSR